MKLASILKSLTNERDITVSQLSKHTGIPVQTLHNWMSGMEPRSLSQVKKVADYFKVSVDFICFGTSKESGKFHDFEHEINAGIFEVILRKVNK
jgi:transcriptional regulator with XRE-family HTH domain